MGTKPVHLRTGVAIDNITFVILEIPWNNNQNVSFTDPNPFLNLAFNSAKAGYTVRTTDSDVI